MAIAAHFITRIYGEIEGNPPFQNSAGATAFPRVKEWPASGIVSLPTDGTEFFPLPNGYNVGSGHYVYSVIHIHPSGLNVHGTKYVTDSSVATLATLAG